MAHRVHINQFSQQSGGIRMKNLAYGIVSTLFLMACGGGGDSSDSQSFTQAELKAIALQFALANVNTLAARAQDAQEGGATIETYQSSCAYSGSVLVDGNLFENVGSVAADLSLNAQNCSYTVEGNLFSIQGQIEVQGTLYDNIESDQLTSTARGTVQVTKTEDNTSATDDCEINLNLNLTFQDGEITYQSITGTVCGVQLS